MSKIPIIDLSPLAESPTERRSNEEREKAITALADSFVQALRNFGFTYIVNHEVPSQLVEEAFEVSTKFFTLSREVKEKYTADPNRHYHGYSRRVDKLHDFQDLRETFDCSGLDRFYPTEVPDFQCTMERLEFQCKQQFRFLLRLLARGLKIDDDFFIDKSKHLFQNGVSSSANFRSLYYPPVNRSAVLAPGTVRTKEHTDYGLITMLFQDNIGGLQIKLRSGEWMPVDPLPGAMVINVGDLMEYWTGSFILATPHRVLIPDDKEKRKLPRQSMAYFTHPDDNALIEPIQSEIIQYSVPFQPVTSFDFVMRKLENVY